MVGNLLWHFQLAAVLQIGGDAGCPESMMPMRVCMPAAFDQSAIAQTNEIGLAGVGVGHGFLEPRRTLLPATRSRVNGPADLLYASHFRMATLPVPVLVCLIFLPIPSEVLDRQQHREESLS
jgi:hypothetical protein